jgi:hypothetical protein
MLTGLLPTPDELYPTCLPISKSGYLSPGASKSAEGMEKPW